MADEPKKQILRKEISRKVEGDKEIVINEYRQLENFITSEELEVLTRINEDDSKQAWVHGVTFDWNGNIYTLDTRRLSDWADEWLADEEKETEEDDREQNYHVIKALNKKLQDYLDYDIWV